MRRQDRRNLHEKMVMLDVESDGYACHKKEKRKKRK